LTIEEQEIEILFNAEEKHALTRLLRDQRRG